MSLFASFDSMIGQTKQKTKEQNPTLTNIGKKWSKDEETDL